MEAEEFYSRLFALDASVHTLFRKTNMREQGKALMQMIGLGVSKLQDLPTLIPVLQSLGKPL